MEAVGFLSMAPSAALAGCITEVITLPFDTAKVHMQIFESRDYPPLKGVHNPLKGVHNPLKGVHNPLKGVHNPLKGVHNPLKGVHNPLKGVHNPLKGVHNPLKGAHNIDRWKALHDTYSDTSRNPSFFTILRSVRRRDGVLSWWSGLSAGLCRQFLYAGTRVALYPYMRNALVSQDNIVRAISPMGCQIIAGMASGAVGIALASPADIIKTRLQSYASVCSIHSRPYAEDAVPKRLYFFRRPAYTPSALYLSKQIINKAGVLGLWRGFLPNVLRNSIVCSAELTGYDELKKRCRVLWSNNLGCHIVAGCGAGFLAATVSSPLDVIKTRYMKSTRDEYKSLLQCALRLFRQAGLKGFYKGFCPNVVRLGAFNSFVFVIYEQCLDLLVHDDRKRQF